MANTIIMSKYQGLGNERRLHFSAREDLGLALTVCSMDR